MAAGVYAREQRLRKQAELQSLKTNLVNLREQEESYVNAQAVIPVRLTEQITKIRQEIEAVEDELVTLGDETIESPAQRFYREAFAAELAQEFDKALKLYKNAARQGHVEANTAIRSLRYLLRTSKNKDASLTMAWASIARTRPKTRFPLAVIIFLIIFILILTLFLSNYLSPPTTEEVIAIASTVTATLSAGPATFVLPATPTTIPTPIPATSTPTSTPINSPTSPPLQGPSPTTSPTPSPMILLRSAPVIIGPDNGLVWKDGTIVFEFENLNLAEGELYCLDTLRGYNQTLTENWSYPGVGSKIPRIPIEANVFRVAAAQNIQCITWSAYIGQGTCETIISERSEEYVIGLPRPCILR